MRFQAAIQIVNAAAVVDPVATPATVPNASIISVPTRPSNADTIRATLLALDAPSAESVTVTVFVVDEATLPKTDIDDPNTNLENRRFYAIQSALVIAGGVAVALTTPVGGALFIRRTADTLTVPRMLRVGIL